MTIKGRDVILYMNNTAGDMVPVCHSRACSLSYDREMLETSGPEGPDRRYLPSYRGGTVSSDGLLVYQDQVNGISVLEWLQGGNIVYFKFATSTQGGLILSGQMYIQQWEMTGDMNNVATYSFSAPIDGPLVITKADIIKQVYLSDLGGVRLAGCPNPYPVGLVWYDGTFIGVANNGGDVMTLFNNYPGNQYYRLTGTDGGCNFTMAIKWNAPTQPNWVPAVPGAGFVIGQDGQNDNVIGQDGNNNNVIGPTG
jgi:predicted secreted protein